MENTNVMLASKGRYLFEQQLTLFDYMVSKEGRNKYVRRIEYDETKPFLLKIHYARRMPCITDAFGLFINGEMVGVVTYGIPASPSLCIGIAGKEEKNKVLELNRLVIKPNLKEKNLASYLVGHSLKMLNNGTYVVSYADTAWSHVGYIYQATNFLYTGLTVKRTDTYQPTGLHPRNYNKENHSSMRQTRSRKHRYIYLVGDKRTKKQMLSKLKYPILPYPKGDEVRYDTNNPKPINPMEIFNDPTT